MSTSECSWRLWPTPGMYVVTSMPLVSRTRATLRSAEFGFFGVCVNTRTHTPRFCGLSCSAGLFVLLSTLSRPCRTSWLIVGTIAPRAAYISAHETPPGRRRDEIPRSVDYRIGVGAPGLGDREAARHLELTYPIKLMFLRPSFGRPRSTRLR